MQTTTHLLMKRRRISLLVLLFVMILSLIVNHYYTPTPPSYIDAKYHMPLVYFLMAYKVIELGIFYMLFYKKHYLKVLAEEYHTTSLKKFKKQAKKFFFLVPQGSIVFGVLSFKLSGDIIYLWFFLALATIVLLWVNPDKLSPQQ